MEKIRTKLIREKMQDLIEINELKKVCLDDMKFLNEAWKKNLQRYEKLEEKRKEILTEINYLAK